MTLEIRAGSVCLISALALTLVAHSVLALRSLSVAGETTVTSTGSFTWAPTGGGAEFICPLTVTKTLSGTISKVTGTLLGRIVGIRFNRPEVNCGTTQMGATLREVIVLNLESPEKYTLDYESIAGGLPGIAAVNAVLHSLLIGVALETILGNPRCLYEEETSRRGVKAREELSERQQLTRTTLGENLLVLQAGGGRVERELCVRDLSLRGTLRATGTPPTIGLV